MDCDVHAPIRTLRFRLSNADHLAYEMLPGRLSFRTKLVLAAWIGSGGLLIGLFPDEWTGLWRWGPAAAIVLLWAALAIFGTNVQVRRRAARRVLPRGEIVLEQWGDHLRMSIGGAVRHIARETIARAVATTGHVFLLLEDEPVVIPRAGFDDDQDMLAFVAEFDGKPLL